MLSLIVGTTDGGAVSGGAVVSGTVVVVGGAVVSVAVVSGAVVSTAVVSAVVSVAVVSAVVLSETAVVPVVASFNSSVKNEQELKMTKPTNNNIVRKIKMVFKTILFLFKGSPFLNF